MKRLKFLLFIILNVVFIVASIEGSTNFTQLEVPILPINITPLPVMPPDTFFPAFPKYEEPPVSLKNKEELKTFNSLSSIQWGLITTSVVAVGIMSYLYAHSQASQKDTNFVAEIYPHAQAWYNELAHKYPQAHLSEKQFLQGVLVSDQDMRWSYFYNQIYCHKAVLEALDVICKKRAANYTLLRDEITFLAVQEFAVLLQAGHIENNHVIKTGVYTIGAVMALEIIKNWYKEIELHRLNNDIIDEALPTAVLLFIELLTLFLLESSLMLDQYLVSYSFACQQADIATLELIAVFFEQYHGEQQVTTYLSHWNNQFYNDKREYMQPEARGKMIRDAIERRLGNQE